MRPLTRPVRLLSDERGLHLYPLLRLMLKELGPEYLAWDSIALRLELEERYKQVGELTWQRIQAGRCMAGHDGYWMDMSIFENCSLALVGEIPVFSHLQPLEAESVAVALHTAGMICERTYSDEVLGYAASCCLQDATWYFEPGSPLDILRPTLEDHDRTYKVSRPYASVTDKLSRHSSAIKDPTGPAEVQVNNVLSVRRVLREYEEVISKQIQELRL